MMALKLTGADTRGARKLKNRVSGSSGKNAKNAKSKGSEQNARTKQWRNAYELDDAEKAAKDKAAESGFKALTYEQAQALRNLHPSISPWRVVGVQAVVGLVAALILALTTGQEVWVWSFLYGAATVVVPGALMARGITSPLARRSPGAGVVSFFVWEAVKVGVSVAMLVLAVQIVQPLSWPALLAGLVLCLKCYWVALLWRGSKKN